MSDAKKKDIGLMHVEFTMNPAPETLKLPGGLRHELEWEGGEGLLKTLALRETDDGHFFVGEDIDGSVVQGVLV